MVKKINYKIFNNYKLINNFMQMMNNIFNNNVMDKQFYF